MGEYENLDESIKMFKIETILIIIITNFQKLCKKWIVIFVKYYKYINWALAIPDYNFIDFVKLLIITFS